jgi:hypothetical protein
MADANIKEAKMAVSFHLCNELGVPMDTVQVIMKAVQLT